MLTALVFIAIGILIVAGAIIEVRERSAWAKMMYDRD